MSIRKTFRHKVDNALLKLAKGSDMQTVAAFLYAPTLAGELAGKCSANFLIDVSARVSNLPPEVEALGLDLVLLKKAERMQELAGFVGGIIAIVAGSVFGGLFFALSSHPTLSGIVAGFLIGLFFPGVPLAFALPGLFQSVSISWTQTGREAIRMAYGVHLRAQARADYWHSLTWRDFELQVANLFRRLGFSVTITGGAGDQGVDIIATHDQTRLLIQCKKYGTPVGPRFIRELLGAVLLQKAGQGVLIASSGFSNAAASAARGTPLLLLDLQDLLEIQKQGSLAEYF